MFDLQAVTQSPLYKQIAAFIDQRSLFKDIDHVDIALSGGADSMALTLVLCAMPRHWSLRAHHIRHGLRPDDGRDAKIAGDLAQRLDIPFIQSDLNLGHVPSNVEEIARNARYDALFAALRAHQIPARCALALAHHGDENLETALWRLGRGCGLEGLCLPPRSLHGDIPLIRPLLTVSKHEIYTFLKSLDIEWAEDPTNQSDLYRRSRIRNDILPNLKRESSNPSALYRSLINIRTDADALISFAQSFARSHLSPLNDWYCPWTDWNLLSYEAKIQVLRHASRLLAASHCPDYRWIMQAIQILERRNPEHRQTEDGEIIIRFSKTGIMGRSKSIQAPPLQTMPIPIPSFQFDIDNLGKFTIYRAIPESGIVNTASMLAIKAIDDPHFNIRPASYFKTLKTADGHITQTREALRSQGIPDFWRDLWPLLCHRDNPLWILGGMRTKDAKPAVPGQMAIFANWQPHLSQNPPH